jgi:phage-related protein
MPLAPSYVLTVRFYATASGREPVRDWLIGLGKVSRQTIGEDIKTVQLGWPLGMPLVRKLEPGLWEVRITVPEGIVRIFFTTLGSDMVLLHAFAKKTQTLPKDDLTLARRRKKEVQDG